MSSKKKQAPAAVREYLASLGKIGGQAGGESKRRDQGDPDYYKRIAAKSAKVRKANAKKKK